MTISTQNIHLTVLSHVMMLNMIRISQGSKICFGHITSGSLIWTKQAKPVHVFLIMCRKLCYATPVISDMIISNVRNVITS